MEDAPTESPPTEGEAAPAEKPWRMFVAIELPGRIRRSISDLTSALQKGFQFSACRPSWASTDTLHLTLRFLGPVPRERVPELIAALEPRVRASEAPRMRAMSLGVFPDWKKPRVLWVGVRDKNDRLIPLQRSIEEAVVELGFDPERKSWKPHLTLARFRSLKGTHVVRGLAKAHDDYRSELFVPQGVTLMRSELRPEGAKHTRVATFAFAPSEGKGANEK